MWQQGTKRLSDGHVFYDDVSGCCDFDWCEDYVIQGGGKVPTTRTGWAETLETCQDPADFAYCTCKVYSCGYSQPHRDWLTFERLIAGTAETDCSYGVGQWLCWGGYLDENPPFSTREEREYLQEHGFDLIDANAGFVKMQRNDVLWKKGHTALYIGEGMQAEALRTERGDAGYDGSTPGDQDQGETVVRKLTLDWDYILRKRNPPTYENGEHMDMEVSDHMAILYDGSDGHVYYWTGDPESVPYHVSGAEKAALEKVYGLKLKKLDKPTADAIMGMCKARKAWREQGIAAAVKEV
jgi:hypothetical protein